MKLTHMLQGGHLQHFYHVWRVFYCTFQWSVTKFFVNRDCWGRQSCL